MEPGSVVSNADRYRFLWSSRSGNYNSAVVPPSMRECLAGIAEKIKDDLFDLQTICSYRRQFAIDAGLAYYPLTVQFRAAYS